jgi:2-polyprenyl-6-methoxyphenol hydroxylase-like FAD-dependent oxidoreductase
VEAQMTDDDVAVVGAGLAGLSMAVALARTGRPSTVYEQADELAEVGAGIQLSPNGTRLLRRLGVDPWLAGSAVRPVAIEMRRWRSGRLLARTELGRACEERYGAPYLTMHRADLHRALVERTRATVGQDRLRLGHRCLAAAEFVDRVDLTFAGPTGRDARQTTDPRHTVGVRLAIGADGVRSVVRDHLVDDQPAFTGVTVYRGLVPADRVPALATPPRVIIWLGPGQHCVCYPVSGGRLLNLVATMPADTWRGESWTAQGDPAQLAAAYARWHPRVRDLLASADPVTRWALHDRAQPPWWSTDRITLVGDAAHPMLPFGAHGAGQALEDAVTLAGCLHTLAGQGRRDGYAGALRRYESLRRPRIERVGQAVRGYARDHHIADGDPQRERDAAMPAARRLAEQDWLYGYDPEHATVDSPGCPLAASGQPTGDR